MDFPPDLGSVIFLFLCGTLSAFLGLLAYIGNMMRDDFKAMSENLRGLAVNVATLTVRLEALDERLEKLEKSRET